MDVQNFKSLEFQRNIYGLIYVIYLVKAKVFSFGACVKDCAKALIIFRVFNNQKSELKQVTSETMFLSSGTRLKIIIPRDPILKISKKFFEISILKENWFLWFYQMDHFFTVITCFWIRWSHRKWIFLSTYRLWPIAWLFCADDTGTIALIRTIKLFSTRFWVLWR